MKRSLTSVLIVAAGVGLAFVAPTPAFGQAVQLPTFSQFSVSTTVMAPDRGGVSLGGVRRVQEGRVSRGVPGLSKLPGLSRLGKNQGIGRTTSTPMLSLHPTIIDLTEMDEALLAKADSASRTVFDAARHEAEVEAARLTSHIEPVGADRARRPAASPAPFVRSTPPSVADLASHRAAARQAKLNKAMQWFDRAQQAERSGKTAVAKVYYRIAGREGDEQLKQVVAKRIRALQGSAQQPSDIGQ